MITFHTATLGCKINQYETQAIVEAWTGAHVGTETDDPALADLILINTCAVTANAVADLRNLVRKMHRANPEAEIVITGCAAEALPEEMAKLPGVSRVVPQSSKANLLSSPEGKGIEDKGANAESFLPLSISNYHRARAVVKVQDGCSHRCTYCIVPLTRGKSISRPVEETLAEIERLFQNGFRELILSGVNLRQFGRDLDGKPEFWDLIEMMEERFAPEWAGKARLRISSLEPGQLGDRALDVLGHSKLICPQLHISLQSGSPAVLKGMGRGHYRPEQALEFAEKLRAYWPTFGLGADILMGFPGETEAMFRETLEFCTKLPLTYAHVFPYSPRPGTAATTMKDQVSARDKKYRAAAVRKLIDGKKKQFLEHLLTLPHLDVLVQDETGKGVSEYYATCRITGSTQPTRDIVRCTPLRLGKGVIIAEAQAK